MRLSLRCRLYRMNRHRRLLGLECIDEENDSQKHERNAEKLSHIEDHVLLEINLGLLMNSMRKRIPKHTMKNMPMKVPL